MNKYELIKKIENFASTETAEPWDCVGFMVETAKTDISKVMLCLTVTENVVSQAFEQGCDMIISHHPLFYVPLEWRKIDIYSAHTNLDKAVGGTTDTVIKSLELENFQQKLEHDFLRFIEFPKSVSVDEFSHLLTKISSNARIVNNKNKKMLKKVAFCAGSGSEFIEEANLLGAEALVTGDLKFHTALDAEIVVYDIGHFESEVLVLPELQKIIGAGVEIVFAQEKSPFSLIR